MAKYTQCPCTRSRGFVIRARKVCLNRFKKENLVFINGNRHEKNFRTIVAHIRAIEFISIALSILRYFLSILGKVLRSLPKVHLVQNCH
jgi:hypothetical protein